MVVRMRHTRAQSGERRSHHAIKETTLSLCECGAQRVSHRACPSCGRYRGRVVVDVVAKVALRAKKREEKNKEALPAGGKGGDKREEQKK